MWHLALSNSKDLGTKGLHSISDSSCSCVPLDLWFCVCAGSVFARKQCAGAWHHLGACLLWALNDLWGLSEASALIWSDKRKQFHCKHQAWYCFDGLPHTHFILCEWLWFCVCMCVFMSEQVCRHLCNIYISICPFFSFQSFVWFPEGVSAAFPEVRWYM